MIMRTVRDVAEATLFRLDFARKLSPLVTNTKYRIGKYLLRSKSDLHRLQRLPLDQLETLQGLARFLTEPGLISGQ